MNNADCTIQLFAKAPVPGQVKTRLVPLLGEEAAAELHRELLAATVETLCGMAGCRVQLWCAPDISHPFFQGLASERGLSLHEQQGAGLGERMAHGARGGLAASGRVILVGADCPELSGPYLQDALDRLDRGADVVIGPAEDGGYVLLGMRRFSPGLFSGISWGGPRVLEQTRSALEGLAWRWEELESLWDLDRPEDLARYQALRSTNVGISSPGPAR